MLNTPKRWPPPEISRGPEVRPTQGPLSMDLRDGPSAHSSRKHPTFNIQRPTSNGGRIGRWMFRFMVAMRGIGTVDHGRRTSLSAFWTLPQSPVFPSFERSSSTAEESAVSRRKFPAPRGAAGRVESGRLPDFALSGGSRKWDRSIRTTSDILQRACFLRMKRHGFI